VVADFLGEHRPDIWVSDRLAAQAGWARRAHQVCGFRRMPATFSEAMSVTVPI